MDILETLTLEIYENKEYWNDGDYIIIMSLLKEFFNDINGFSSQTYKSKEEELEEDLEEDFDWEVHYDEDGYRIDPSYTDSALPPFLRS